MDDLKQEVVGFIVVVQGACELHPCKGIHK